VQSEGRDRPAGAQEAAVRLAHQPITLPQSIVGEQPQGGGVGEEQRQPEVLRQPEELLHRLLRRRRRLVTVATAAMTGSILHAVNQH